MLLTPKAVCLSMANETYFLIVKQILKATYPTDHFGLHSDDIMWCLPVMRGCSTQLLSIIDCTNNKAINRLSLYVHGSLFVMKANSEKLVRVKHGQCTGTTNNQNNVIKLNHIASNSYCDFLLLYCIME